MKSSIKKEEGDVLITECNILIQKLEAGIIGPDSNEIANFIAFVEKADQTRMKIYNDLIWAKYNAMCRLADLQGIESIITQAIAIEKKRRVIIQVMTSELEREKLQLPLDEARIERAQAWQQFKRGETTVSPDEKIGAQKKQRIDDSEEPKN